MKRLFFATILFASVSANAGFVTGSVMSSGLGSSNQAIGSLLASDKNDVIICGFKSSSHCIENYRANVTLSDGGSEWKWIDFTPEQYAKHVGYNHVHKRAVFFDQSGRKFHVMEVSK